MKFFIDTANVEEIREAWNMGLIDGVTTNPSLIARERRVLSEVINEICEIVDGPISVEVIGLSVSDMLKEARSFAKFNKNIVIKIPMTINGLNVVRQLSSENIATNMTLVFTPLQALMAAKVGATYVSPFVGRLDDLSQNGMKLVEQIIKIYNNYKFDTKVIVASIRSPVHILKSAMFCADIVTMSLNTLKKIVKHPLTKSGLEDFLNDWEKSKK